MQYILYSPPPEQGCQIGPDFPAQSGNPSCRCGCPIWQPWRQRLHGSSCMEETKPCRLVGMTAAVLPPLYSVITKWQSARQVSWYIVGLGHNLMAQGRLCVYIFISRLCSVLSRSEDRSWLHSQYSGVFKRMYVIESWGKLQFQDLFHTIVIFWR